MATDRRCSAGAVVLAAVAAALALATPAAAVVEPAGPLSTARPAHTATLLPSGKVLAVGGNGTGTTAAGAELYDPATNAWTLTGSLTLGRYDHAAALLGSGRVIVIGGYALGSGRTATTERFDPLTGGWTAGPTMPTTVRDKATATVLPGGGVLVVGGTNGSGPVGTVELYDPLSNSWIGGRASLTTPRVQHTATLLPSGKVLVVGGYLAGFLTSAELYDPSTNSWSPAGNLTTGRLGHTATLLASGKVLVAGGDGSSGPLSSAELYDPAAPAASAWSPAGALLAARSFHTATRVASGKVLVVGGQDPASPSLELYDPATNGWSTAGSLARSRYRHTATLLPSGKVLVVGGDDGTFELGSAELVSFSSAAVEPAAVAFPATVRGSASTTATVTLRSTGETPWLVSTVRLAGADPDQFKLLTETCTGARLEPGQSCTLSLRFSPVVTGALSASVVIGSNGSGPDQVVALSGTGTEVGTGTGGAGGAAATTVVLDRAAFRVTWRKGVPTGSVRVAGTTSGAGALTFTLRRVTRSGSKPVKGWSFQQPGAGPFAKALPVPRTLLPGSFRIDVTGSSLGGTVPRVARDLKLTGPPEGIVRDAYASATPGGGAATRLPGARREVWATFVFAALPTRGRITVAWLYPGHQRLPPVSQRVGKPRRPTVSAGVIGRRGDLPRGRYTAVLFVGAVELRRVSVRIG